MSHGNFNPHDMIDAYLDGQLPRADRAKFEQLLQTDFALAALVNGQGAIDASLRRMYVPPAAIAIPRRLPPHRPLSRLRVSWRTTAWLRVAAAAASLLFGIGMLYHAYVTEFAPMPSSPPRPSMAAVYHSEVDHGFHAAWKCSSDQQFADTFKSRFGIPLMMKHPPADIEALGLSYRGCITDETTYMLAKVQSANTSPTNVMVFIDRCECSENVGLPQGTDLHLFTKNVGGLMLYEVTPLNEPKLLDLFYQPATPAQHTSTPQIAPHSTSTTQKWN